MIPSSTPADALVFFGATGDLAYKKIFPALHGMARHGHLTMPVIAVASQARGGPSRPMGSSPRPVAGSTPLLPQRQRTKRRY